MFFPLPFLVLPLPPLLLLLPLEPLPAVTTVKAARSCSRAPSSRSKNAAEAGFPAPLNSARGRKPVDGSTPLLLLDCNEFGCRPLLILLAIAAPALAVSFPTAAAPVVAEDPTVAAGAAAGAAGGGASPKRPPVHTNLPSAPRLSTIVDEDEVLFCGESGDCIGGAGAPPLPGPEPSNRLLSFVGCLATAYRQKDAAPRTHKSTNEKALRIHNFVLYSKALQSVRKLKSVELLQKFYWRVLRLRKSLIDM